MAGSFYPADPDALRSAIRRCVDDARPPAAGAAVPRAVVAPHAGYRYSGPVAASAHLRLGRGGVDVRRAVVVGPGHTAAGEGLVVSGADAWATPLGPLVVDRDARARALRCPAVRVDDRAHAREHSIEVQLPFLQELVGDVAVLPLLTGRCRPGDVADVLEAVWDDDPATVVVVSSDLSHYLPYDRAVATDRATADAVVAGDVEAIGPRDACGADGVRGLLVVAERRGLRLELVDLRNSGDTAGDRTAVVGYGAFAAVADATSGSAATG